MLKNWKALVAALTLSAGMFGAGAVYTSSAHAQTYYTPRPNLRGERGSARNLLVERRRLDGVIDALQRDQRDYGGHRVAAINLLQQGRVQLQAAIDYDATHGR